MSNVFVAFITLIVTFQMFNVSYSLTGINRAVINTPIELIQSSIPVVDIDNLYYDKTLLEGGLLNYYNQSLSRFTKDFDIYFYYYNKEDESMCIVNECNAFEVTVDAVITMNIPYHRVMFYEIRG